MSHAFSKRSNRFKDNIRPDEIKNTDPILLIQMSHSRLNMLDDNTVLFLQPQEQAESQDSCSKNLAEHHQGRNSASGDVFSFQTSGRHLLQRI